MANRNSQGFGLVEAMRVGNTPSIQGQSKYKIDAGRLTTIYKRSGKSKSASTGGYIVTDKVLELLYWCFKWNILQRCYYFEANVCVTSTKQQLLQTVKISLHL